jgi:hypothetical protein
MNWQNVMRLLLALTILVSVFLRPPGTMLVLDGGTISYEICTGGETEMVTVALDGDASEKIDLGCDFFAAQIAALPFESPDVAPTEAEAVRLSAVFANQIPSGQTGWPFYNSRAPPLVS